MAVYMITYDLNKEGQKYNKVIEAINECSIEQYSVWKSSYLIKSDMTAKQISDKISQFLDGNDKMIVIEAKSNYDGWLPHGSWEYLQEKIFR